MNHDMRPFLLLLNDILCTELNDSQLKMALMPGAQRSEFKQLQVMRNFYTTNIFLNF
jgi:hypothetical protein